MEKIPVKMAPRLTENWRIQLAGASDAPRQLTVGICVFLVTRFFCRTWSGGEFRCSKVCGDIAWSAYLVWNQIWTKWTLRYRVL